VFKQQINGLKPFILFDHFRFSRSDESIKDFTMSQSPEKTIMACIIYRSLHVYDFMTGAQLFQIKLPNSSKPSNSLCKNLFFLEDDSMLLVKDGNRRLIFLNIDKQFSMFNDVQGAQKNDTSGTVTIDVSK